MQKDIITLGSLHLTSRVMNAAGPWASTQANLLEIYNSHTGAVVTKTFTLEPSLGNVEPNTYFHPDFSINSVGLTNKGADYFISGLKQLGGKKPLIASIAESSPAGFLELAQKVNNGGFSAIELNLSCPNLLTKEPLAYDPMQLDALLDALFKNTSVPIGVKLPPYVTRSQISQVTDVLSHYPINHLVLINTYPFATVYMHDEAVIKPNHGIGGLGGSYLKPIALAHVTLFKELMPDVPLVGVGGISTNQDVKDFLKAGASAVQVGSAIQNHGVKLLDKLATQF